jgi:hypothetical protein
MEPVILLVGLVVVIILFLYYLDAGCKTSYMVSGNEFPEQREGTAEMAETIAGGYNKPENVGATDPYYDAMIDFASQENAWLTKDWSATE